MLEVSIKRTIPEFSLEVSFTMGREVVAILGPSGCGKTMTLKCIAGLVQPDAGRIILDDKPLFDSSRGVNLLPQERRVGFVFQNYALFPNMNVYRNIAFGIRHRSQKEVEARVCDLMRVMRLDSLGHRYPRQLSAGQQQRVALARALAFEPEVLLLDEPFSALDTIVKERLEEQLQDIQQFYNGHVLFVTHNLAEAYRLSSKIAVYESGSILQFAHKQEVVDYPASQTVARLTGAVNLMKGLIAGVNRRTVHVLIPGLGKKLRLASKNAAALYNHQPVIVGIRPEYIRVTEEAGDNTFEGKVTASIEGVSSYIYRFHINSGAEECFLEANASKLTGPCLAEGDTCCLHLPPERLFLIPGSVPMLTTAGSRGS